jgi:two-component system, NtrC family, response regulator GlrR
MMTDKPRVLLVDDDEDLLHLIRMRLQANNLDVNAVGSAQRALSELARYRPHLVITDLQMPGMDGMALFELIQERYLHLPVIILTAHGTIPDAVAAVQKGVFSYLVKPFDANVLLENVNKALAQSRTHVNERQAEGSDNESWRREILSCSPVMENLLQQAKAAAGTDVSILIQSETGTGKELLAKAIHRASARRNQAFMTLNCAAIPETLLESELFGHAAGAFTGAVKARDGLFKAADKGTVFLDEIGDMPLTAQAKLLRVLEQGEVRPVGSTETIKVDVRILSATHHDLRAKVRQGSFREDLFYRLNVITLEQPPLSARREDIPLLANHFAQLLSERHSRALVRFAPESMELLVSAPWPGNVRQLLNVVEQCVVLSTQPLVPRQLVERALRFKPQRLLSLNDARDQFEHDYLIRLLNLAEGNVALAARLAERNRSEFYNLLGRHGLDPAQFRKTTTEN